MVYNQKIRKIAQICGIVLLSIGLTACGSNQSGNGSSSQSSKGQQSQTRQMTDAMGHKVNVPVQPKRVLASYMEDYLVALGVKPVAQWSVSNGIQEYLQDDLKGVPTISYDLPFEEVQKFKPDLIIMNSASMVEGGKYEQYSQIAPTYVASKEQNNDWRKELRAVGKVLNKEAKAGQVLADYEKTAKKAKEKLAENGRTPSAAAIWLVNNKFFIVSQNVSSGTVLYNDLGLKVPDVVKEISAKAASNWNAISLEKLTELDADYIFLINSDKNSATELDSALWKNIPAVKKHHVAEFSANSSWLYTGTIANQEIIRDVLKTIDK